MAVEEVDADAHTERESYLVVGGGMTNTRVKLVGGARHEPGQGPSIDVGVAVALWRISCGWDIGITWNICTSIHG